MNVRTALVTSWKRQSVDLTVNLAQIQAFALFAQLTLDHDISLLALFCDLRLQNPGDEGRSIVPPIRAFTPRLNFAQLGAAQPWDLVMYVPVDVL